MATIVHKRINGYGPYAWKVTYSGGKHHWEWIGKVGEETPESGPITNTSETGSDAAQDTEDERGETHAQPTQPGESPAAAPHTRTHYEQHLDRIPDGEEYPENSDFYDSRTRWVVDQITEHYHKEHDIRVALTNAESTEQLRAIVADIEEAREAGLLDGITKITDATGDALSEKHDTVSAVNAEYEPEPRDIVGNSMGYQPTLTLNAETYRPDGQSSGVKSYGTEYNDDRHALWHELAHHQHLQEYHDAGEDVESVMNAEDDGVWDRMHAAMDPYRDAITNEFDRSVSHDPIEFYADAWARQFRGEKLPSEIEEVMNALEAEQILTD